MALPVVGISSAVLGGLPYAYANVQESVAGYFSVVLVAWLAAWAAFPVAFAARVLRCRNRTYVKLVSIGTALAAVYFAWTFFAGGMLARGLLAALVDGATDPVALWRFVMRVLVEGWYDIAGVRPTGVMLGTMWVLEAVLVVSSCVVVAPRFIAGRAYCEACGAWCVKGKDVLVPVTAGRTMRGIRHAGIESLQAVVIPDETTRTLQIYTLVCPRCRTFAVFGANQLHRPQGRRSLSSALVESILPMSVRRDEDAANIERIRELLKNARAKQFANVEIEPRPRQG